MSEVKFGRSTPENLKQAQIAASDWKEAQLRRQASPSIWNSMLNAATYVPRELSNASLMQAEDMSYGPEKAKAVLSRREALEQQALDAYKQGQPSPSQWGAMLKGNWRP